MTIRKRLAAWLDPDTIREHENAARALIRENIRLEKLAVQYSMDANDAAHRLAIIADMETPGANATVKRMARAARGEA